MNSFSFEETKKVGKKQKTQEQFQSPDFSFELNWQEAKYTSLFSQTSTEW